MTGRVVVTEPGVYAMSNADYHRDPVPAGSLSSTGARKLVAPSVPALFRAWLDEGEEPNRNFDLGGAAHRRVLSAGEEIVVVDAENWRTSAAKFERDEAYAAGKVPVLPKEAEQVEAMAEALYRHPVAQILFDPDTGDPEQALFWRDEATGIWRRALLDWMQRPVKGRRLVVGDYKTCANASPDAVSKAMAAYGYHMQGAWYLDAVRALGLAGDLEPAFLFVFQEKTYPYLVTVAQPNPEAMLWGARRNREAVDTYQRCVETNTWPGYADDVISIGLPAYTIRTLEDAYELSGFGVAS